MNKNVLIVLGGAVLVAVLVAMLVQLSLNGDEAAPVEVVEEVKVEILVAAKDLKLGHELKPGDLRWQEWPKASTFPGMVTREDGQSASEALEGRLSRVVSEGEPMMSSALVDGKAGNMVSASLKPGMRAISIEVSASSMVSGFIGPGDYVDVLLTYRETPPEGEMDDYVRSRLKLSLDKMATETILQNVRILAVDQMASRPDEDQAKVGRTVTLAVSAQDAEKLFLAGQMGELILALRGVGDDIVFEKKWDTVTDARITSADDEMHKELEKLQKGSGIKGNNVRIYNGGVVQDMSAK